MSPAQRVSVRSGSVSLGRRGKLRQTLYVTDRTPGDHALIERSGRGAKERKEWVDPQAGARIDGLVRGSTVVRSRTPSSLSPRAARDHQHREGRPLISLHHAAVGSGASASALPVC